MNNMMPDTPSQKAERIRHLIRMIRTLGIIELPDAAIEMPLKCQADSPVQYDKSQMEEDLSITLPEDLVSLWQEVSELRLFEDILYGQSGLILWSPLEVAVHHKEAIGDRPEQYTKGDLVIGELKGDQEMLVVRCDKHSTDFGRVVIALPVYSRQDWYVAAKSLIDFLTYFFAARGEKFWERPDRYSNTPSTL
jgi:hypothetical protein